jgi:hypothetical protein
MQSYKLPGTNNTGLRTRWKLVFYVLAALFFGTTVVLHSTLGERPAGDEGIRAWLDTSYGIVLYLFITLTAGGLGWKILIVSRLATLEEVIPIGLIALAIGYGILGYGALFLGLTGLLQPGTLIALLLIGNIIGFQAWGGWLRAVFKNSDLRTSFKQLALYQKTLTIFGLLILLLTFFQTLTPAWDYDSLLYHMEVPRKFLAAGGISPQPEEWLTYFPLTLEMVYTIGLGLDSEIPAKLVHLTFGLILVFSTFSFGKRFVGERSAWVAVGVLLGVPIIPVWASWAYIDMGFSTFASLSAFAIITWHQTRKMPWLVIASVLLGFTMGTKYMGLSVAASLGLLVLWFSRKHGWRAFLTNGTIFGGIAALIAAPWYIKNIIWTGNPIYPLIAGPPSWSPFHMEIWTSFLRGFGTGTTLVDYLFLPINLYLRHDRFSTSFGVIEFPSFLFPLIVLYPLVKHKGVSNIFIYLSVSQFLLWSVGSQVNRYLLPIYPFLSLLTGIVIANLMDKVRLGKIRPGFVLSNTLIFFLVAINLVFQISIFSRFRPLGVATGQESKTTFLRRMVNNQPAIEFINNLAPDSRILMMWDGKGYYCNELCIPDIDHSQWTDIVVRSQQDTMAVVEALDAIGITHLLMNHNDADYILKHDPAGYQKDAWDFFVNTFQQACTRELFGDGITAVYAITCSP